MAVYVVGQKSGVDTPEVIRYALSMLMHPTGALDRHSGIVPVPGAALLTGVSPMVGRISPFLAWVDGTTSGTQGGYPVIVTANEDLTFDPGEAAVNRVDRIVLQVRDNPYDASGSQDGRVRIVKGQAGGAANAVPASSILLWEKTVPMNASVGGGGFDMSAQRTDHRPWLSALGGVQLVNSKAERDALTPYEGMQVYRLDAGDRQVRRGGVWAWDGVPRTVQKFVTEDVYNNTYQPDDALVLGVAPGGYYDVEVIGNYAADSDFDLKIGFTAPTGSGMTWLAMGKGGTGQPDGVLGQPDWVTQDVTGEPRLGGRLTTDNTSPMAFYARGTLYSGDGGNLTLRWAQDATGGGAPTKMLPGSRMIATRIGAD